MFREYWRVRNTTREKKGTREYPLSHLVASLSGMNSFNRAHVGAGAAIGANIRVDLVDVALGDSFNRALIDTCSASGAIFIDLVSHIESLKLN
jgi:hypothetical protein